MIKKGRKMMKSSYNLKNNGKIGKVRGGNYHK